MQNRDKNEIIRQILDIANGAVNITKTKIIYKAFLSYKQLKEYLMLLTERDQISCDSVTLTYKTTEKDLRLLQFYDELDKLMKKSPQQRIRRLQ
jgi:predicted transcriptional regulator